MGTDEAERDDIWGWRHITLMWVFAARLTLERFDAATSAYVEALEADHFLESWRGRGLPADWAEHVEDAKRTPVTDRLAWTATLEQHFALNALAQVRKCVRGLNERGDTLPVIRNAKMLRLLRDAHEHWEQAENGRSLAELQRIAPAESPGTIRSTGRDHIIAGIATSEIDDWLRQIDHDIRLDAADAGQPFLDLGQPLT